jgi:hypothetical protein
MLKNCFFCDFDCNLNLLCTFIRRMKNLLILLSIQFVANSIVAQEENTIKSKLINTWRVCGLEQMSEQDTLTFSPKTGDCRAVDCGEHQWSFRKGGSVEFIFTTGCNTGFQSKAQNPERWMYSEKTNVIKMISIDAFVRQFEVIQCNENILMLKRRKDLE